MDTRVTEALHLIQQAYELIRGYDREDEEREYLVGYACDGLGEAQGYLQTYLRTPKLKD